MLNLNSPAVCKRRSPLALVTLCIILLSSALVFAQSTAGTGSIQVVVSDQTGAVVSGAKLTITNKATSGAIRLTTSSAGTYTSGAIQPGDYTVRVEAKTFKTAERPVTAQVGVVSSGNVRLELGQESQVVVVQATQAAVNTEQATVQGVLTASQIDNLPVNGRNFLDLAQLEPGVQIQEGSTFDPTKNGFSSISFEGRFGRTARIEVDGIDISDENVGTTTQNIPQSAIAEFQVEGSSLDLTTEISGTGAINVATRSGTNSIHGEGFYDFRNDELSARFAPTDLPYSRKQYGA